MRRLETTLSFPADSAFLAGHFPGNPVVPAVAILATLVGWVERGLGRRVAGVHSARFRRSLPPDIEWRVVLEEKGRDAVTLTGTEADHVALNLRLRLEPV